MQVPVRDKELDKTLQLIVWREVVLAVHILFIVTMYFHHHHNKVTASSMSSIARVEHVNSLDLLA